MGFATAANLHSMLGLSLLATILLSGCMTGDDDGSLPYSSFEEARSAEGRELEPADDGSPFRLKLLNPSSSNVETGELEILVLVFDTQSRTAVTDADFGEDQPQCGASHGFCAQMPDMGHGTSPEEAPEHLDHGVYRGMTTISMAGNWTLQFRPQIDGQILEYSTQLRASE